MADERTSRKTDLLVRVRYQNPLPPPPFPPRLVHIPTTPLRYAGYDFLTPLHSERELPMILDGELGMPLEYGRAGEGQQADSEYWLGNRSAITPSKEGVTLADEDAFLLEDPTTASSAAGPSNAAPGTPAQGNMMDVSKKVDVSWLRRTEYLSSEATTKPLQAGQAQGSNGNTPRRAQIDDYDPFDRDARARNITSTFSAAHIPLDQLQHPTKSQVKAVEAYDLLPDSDLWANEYDLIRFGEDPGDKGLNELPRLGPDPRLPRAIFRDLTEALGEDLARVSLFFPQDDATAVAYTQKRMAGDETLEGESYEFRWVRDYQVASIRPLQQEYIFTFDAGEAGSTPEENAARPATAKGREKGAYYVPISNVTQLRKRRAKKGEDVRSFPVEVEDQQFWDGMSISLHHPPALLEADALARWQSYKQEVEQGPDDLPMVKGKEKA